MWLGILCLVFPLSSAGFPIENPSRYKAFEREVIPNSYKRLINPYLRQDYTSLQRKVGSRPMDQLSKEQFISLFYKGIEKAHELFSEEYYSKNARKKYEKGVKKILHAHRSLLENHGIEIPLINPNIQPSLKAWSMVGDSIFESFSGEWYGSWRAQDVNHYWLPTHNLSFLSMDGIEISVLAFQSVFTGDGIGWNYVIQKEDIKFLLGFVVHFNDLGRIYLERPHIGIPQENGAIIWKTKDHMYLEFVSSLHRYNKEEECYIIVGISFYAHKKNLRLIEAFRAIYTRNPMLRPEWVSLKKR